MSKLSTFKITGKFFLSSAWALVILVACIIPVNKVHKSFLFDIKHLDKYFHFIMYLAFTVILYIDFNKYKHALKNKYLILVLITVITLSWGIIIELVQYYFIISRKGSISDILVNVIGIITGIVLVLTTRKYILKI